MAKNWWCGYCHKDIDTQKDACGSPGADFACPLWWQPVTWFAKLQCKIGRCLCPVGPSYCKNCQDK